MTIIADGIIVVARNSNAAITSDGAFNDNTGATISIDGTKCSDIAIICIYITRNGTANSIDSDAGVVDATSCIDNTAVDNAIVSIDITRNGTTNIIDSDTGVVDATSCNDNTAVNNAIISIDITCNGTANIIDNNTGVVDATSCNNNTAVSIVSFT